MRFCIVLSSGGSVVKECLKFAAIQNAVYSICTDRQCEAQNIAATNNISLVEFADQDNVGFSDKLLQHCISHNVDIILSFHLRLYKGNLLNIYKNRIVNFHISLLPAFSGFNSFEKAIEYGVRILGTTVHFIDETVDRGLPIMQSALINNPGEEMTIQRHKIFIQQCKSFIQVVSWFLEGRIIVKNNRCIIANSNFKDLEFVPSLDSPLAISLFQ